MRAVLISTYELGHQPFGVASPAAWLASRGMEVTCLDLSRQPLRAEAIRGADLIAFYLPMHTATRLAIAWLGRVQALNPRAHICFYGLYAPVNGAHLRELGAHTILGGECEAELAQLAEQLRDSVRKSDTEIHAGENTGAIAAKRVAGAQRQPEISLERLKFLLPERGGLPSLERYARVVMADGARRIAGYTESSRGCKHLCRHCPVVPVYGGAFRIVERGIVLEDIQQQVAAGAQHITFGDPDFFNGPTHALAIVAELHRRFPQLSYDATIKIEHLLKHARHLPALRDSGCLFVTSAVESVDDEVLARLDKGHTRADFLRVTRLFRERGLVLHPTFVPFTPWTTLESYVDLLEVIAEQELVPNVAPIQLAIRLLIPAGSRLLELGEVRQAVDRFDREALVYPWWHQDLRVDALATEVSGIVERGEKWGRSRAEIFWRIAQTACALASQPTERIARHAKPIGTSLPSQHFALGPEVPPVPHLEEPWYCCAEPSAEQFAAIHGSSAESADGQLVAPRPTVERRSGAAEGFI